MTKEEYILKLNLELQELQEKQKESKIQQQLNNYTITGKDNCSL